MRLFLIVIIMGTMLFISDEISNEPFACEKGKTARQIKYLSSGESILVTSCYIGNNLKSFSQYQSGLAGEWTSQQISTVAAIMREVENSIEKHCEVKGLRAGMKSNCGRKNCDE